MKRSMKPALSSFLCTGAFLNVPYSFLLISNKFCEISLLHWPMFRDVEGGGASAVRKIYCTVYNLTALCTILPHSPPQPVMGPGSSWKLMYIKLPMDLWLIRSCDLYGMFLMWASRPWKSITWAIGMVGPWKSPLLWAQPFPSLVMDLPASKTLHTGPYKS